MRKFFFTVLAAMLALSQPSDAQTRQQRLMEHVYYFAADSLNGRRAGSEDAVKAADYIIDRFEGMGLDPCFTTGWKQTFTKGDTEYANVVGLIEGCDPELSGEYIVIGAHYDHLGVRDGKVYNGADDNASGSAAIIELARELLARRGELKRSVIIAAFDAEEIGLYGSDALCGLLKELVGAESVKLMMSVDMVGWLAKSGSLKLEGSGTISGGNALLRDVAGQAGIDIRPVAFETSLFTATDTQSFAQEGIPTLDVTTGTKSPYHKPQDDADLIDYEGLDKVTGYLAELTVRVASDESFASSGKVADKHRKTVRKFQAGIEGGLGSGYLLFPEASFNGKDKFCWDAGLVAQYNFSNEFALRAEGLYESFNCRFPDTKDMFGPGLVYGYRAVTVPLSLVVSTGRDEAIGTYIGLGAYYSRVLGTDSRTSVPSLTYNPNLYGIGMNFGLWLGHVDFNWTIRRSLTGIFNGIGDPVAESVMNTFQLIYLF